MKATIIRDSVRAVENLRWAYVRTNEGVYESSTVPDVRFITVAASPRHGIFAKEVLYVGFGKIEIANNGYEDCLFRQIENCELTIAMSK